MFHVFLAQVKLHSDNFLKSWQEFHPVEAGEVVKRVAVAVVGADVPAGVTRYKVDRDPAAPLHQPVFVDAGADALTCTCREYGDRLLCRHIWCIVMERVSDSVDMSDVSPSELARAFVRHIGKTAWVGQSFAAADSAALHHVVARYVIVVTACVRLGLA
jgi:hypothetical protein